MDLAWACKVLGAKVRGSLTFLPSWFCDCQGCSMWCLHGSVRQCWPQEVMSLQCLVGSEWHRISGACYKFSWGSQKSSSGQYPLNLTRYSGCLCGQTSLCSMKSSYFNSSSPSSSSGGMGPTSGRLQVFHILKQGEFGNVLGALPSDSIGSSDFQYFEGSQPLGC